jgi:hypothetical protein
MKHPPKQFSDDIAYKMTEEFIAGQDIEGEHIVSGPDNNGAVKASKKFVTG